MKKPSDKKTAKGAGKKPQTARVAPSGKKAVTPKASKPGSRAGAAKRTRPARAGAAKKPVRAPLVQDETDKKQMALDLMGEMAREISRQIASGDNNPATVGANPGNRPALPNLALDPAELIELQNDYLQRAGELLRAGPQAAQPRDRRFSTEPWRTGMFAWNAALYELNAEFMARFANAAVGDAKSVERVRFATQQWIDAASPTNFLVSNPEAQKAIVDTGGQSLMTGLNNLLDDFKRGHISQSDESAFEVGRELAITPGSVVFQNELIQLIQYSPATETVGKTPMLMVPPCINKFYILDLQPENSLVAHLVEQGHTVFMLSWRNPQAELGHLTWDDYLSLGPIEAIRVVQEICGTEQINALGFCVGGTILSTALAVLAAQGRRPVKSLTLLTTLLDFEESGILNIFIDEAAVALRDATLGQGGILPGSELAQTFSALRPNDLIWNYVVKNYLHGQAPPAFDLLYWNGDSTNLPGPMFVYYLRHMYLQNELSVPGRLTCLGESVDLGNINLPTYIYGSRDDHIVPWKSAYESSNLLTGELRFVLGASGHIAGVINPPAKHKRNYWVNDKLVPDADDWLDDATEVAGSWWPDWCQWLDSFRDGEIQARTPGSAAYPALEPAPGQYVKQKA